MEGEFPYLKITEKLRRIVGEQDDDTRIFRTSGRVAYFPYWLAALHRETGEMLVASSWVPTIVGVSRTAFHKRVKSGRLTVLVFHNQDEKPSMISKVAGGAAEYSLCVLSECNAWRDEIAFREERRKSPRRDR